MSDLLFFWYSNARVRYSVYFALSFLYTCVRISLPFRESDLESTCCVPAPASVLQMLLRTCPRNLAGLGRRSGA